MTLEVEVHKVYGRQYTIRAAHPRTPATTEGIAGYLRGCVHGLGPKRTAQLQAALGVELPAVLDARDVARITAATTVPQRVAEQIVTQWHQRRDMAELCGRLFAHGIDLPRFFRLQRHFGPALHTVITTTPYRVTEVRGIGFPVADALARAQGMDHDAPARIWAGMQYQLERTTYSDGHCWSPRSAIEAACVDLLDLPQATIAAVPDPPPPLLVATESMLALSRIMGCERTIADQIALLLHTPALQQWPDDGWTTVRHAVDTADPRLSDEQWHAVVAAIKAKSVVITGGPGTGKTTIIRAIVQTATMLDCGPVVLCAPTGKAALRLAEASGHQAATVHRTLQWGAAGPAHHGDNPLGAGTVIVDEASMLDVELAAALLAAIPPYCRIIFVGDDDQLPSIGPGRVLTDLCRVVPHVALTTVYRQAAQSRVVQLAHALRNASDWNWMPDGPAAPRTWTWTNQVADDDLFFFQVTTPQEVVAQTVTLVAERIPHTFGIAADAVKVLAPQYAGRAGINVLNSALQAALNPPAAAKPDLPWNDGVLRVGDRLIWLTNDYTRGLLNGTELRVDGLFREENRQMVQVVSDDGITQVMRVAELDARHAYALSVHKAQGSEYPAVVVVCDERHRHMLQRPSIYTAVTRSRKLCVLVGQRHTFARAAIHDGHTHRRTHLAQWWTAPGDVTSV